MLNKPKKIWNPSVWASWKPFGIGEQYPNNYWEGVRAVWENRDRLSYAWDILNHGVCDGCSLGTTGMKDWTFGAAATTCSYKDWIGTDLLVFFGSNVANNQLLR